jgi:hypothetical protein
MNQNRRWLNDYQFESIDIITEKKTQSLIGQVQAVRYEEQAGKTLKVTILFADTFGFLASMPIRSGDRVRLKIKHGSVSDEPFEFSEKRKNELIIAEIGADTGDTKRELFTLVCVTRSTLNNHTTRVIKRYKGKITDSVQKIFKEVLDVDSSRVNIPHPAMNEYTFTGNFQVPLKQISRLAAKCMGESDGGNSAEKGSCGYILSEGERKGYQFFSVDKQIKEKEEFTYTQQSYKSASELNNFSVVSQPVVATSHDIVKKLMVGQYKSANWYYNIVDHTPHFVEYSYKNSKLPSANEDQYVPNGIDDKYSRIFLNVLDLGAMTEKKAELRSSAESVAWRQAHATARLQSLFSQTLEVTIPMNLSLRVGSILKFEFPRLNKKSKGVNPQSGNYMVAKIAHVFGDPQGDYTGLSLVRDSFAFYSE